MISVWIQIFFFFIICCGDKLSIIYNEREREREGERERERG